MFLINSRYHHFSATPSSSGREALHPTGAHLLPKLRCHFAEFLSQGSLTRLRMLSSPTCVGLRYDHLDNSLEAFLGSVGSIASGQKWPRHHALVFELGTRFCQSPPPTRLHPEQPSPGRPTLLRHSLAQTTLRGTGILTCYPSATPFGLTLGPTNPTRINLPSETLDLRGL